MKIRALQIDLARQKETIAFLREFIDFAAANGYNSILFYIEGRIKTKSFPYPSDAEAYSVKEMKDLVAYAAKKKIEIIPCVSVLGHAELFLKYKELLPLSETRDSQGRFGGQAHHDFCPSAPGFWPFMEKYLAEICEIFPSKYFHAGCDEAFDVGFCDLCRKRMKKDGLGDIFVKHIEKTRQVLKKLGKRMMIWDDMIEFFPEKLQEISREIIMVCWLYGDTVRAYRGHFSNSLFQDIFAVYEKLGFEYIFAPSDFTYNNIFTFTEYAKKYNPLGGLVTSWEKSTCMLYQSFPSMAAAGRLWSDRKNKSADSIFAETINALFGIKDPAFIEALKTYCSTYLHYERRTSSNNYLTIPEAGFRYHERSATKLSFEVISSYKNKIKTASGILIAEDIILSLKSRILTNKIEDLFVSLFTHPENIASDKAAHSAILKEIDEIAAKRIKMWKTLRKNIMPVKFEEIYRKYHESIASVLKLAQSKGTLLVHFFLPEQYSATKVEIKIKYEGSKTWDSVANGVYKNIYLNECFYTTIFTIDKTKALSVVRVEFSGYGAQGLTYIESFNNGGHCIPEKILKTSGTVITPENLLRADLQWCFAGESDTLKTINNPELSKKVSALELKMKKAL